MVNWEILTEVWTEILVSLTGSEKQSSSKRTTNVLAKVLKNSFSL